MPRKRQPPPAPTPEPYKPSAAELAAVETLKARRDTRPKFPEITSQVGSDGVAQISSKHDDETFALALQLNALGLGSHREFTALLKNVVNTTQAKGGLDNIAVNEMLALVVGIAPKNTTEAMIAVQMAALHDATLTAARLNRTASTIDQAAAASRSMNNCSRTFATLAETLKKLRGNGEQKVVVEHKHYHLHPGAVAPGAQAVIGDLHQPGGRGTSEIDGQSHERDEQLRFPAGQTMLGTIEALGLPMPGAGDEGQERVPIPRGQGGGAEG